MRSACGSRAGRLGFPSRDYFLTVGYVIMDLGVTDREAPASGLAAKVPTGHAAHSRDSDQNHRT
jgi:hypothetical protein